MMMSGWPHVGFGLEEALVGVQHAGDAALGARTHRAAFGRRTYPGL